MAFIPAGDLLITFRRSYLRFLPRKRKIDGPCIEAVKGNQIWSVLIPQILGFLPFVGTDLNEVTWWCGSASVLGGESAWFPIAVENARFSKRQILGSKFWADYSQVQQQGQARRNVGA